MIPFVYSCNMNALCVFGAAKSKGQRTKAFLRVLKYSHGGVLEV